MSGGSVKISSLVVVDSVLSLSWARPGGIDLQRAIFFYVHLCSFVKFFVCVTFPLCRYVASVNQA